jgi:hypothetical protein
MMPAEQSPDALRDMLKVVGPNGIVLAALNVLTIKGWLELSVLTLSIGYTIWRWRRDLRNDHKN